MLPGARRAIAHRRIAQYNNRPNGFASGVLMARARAAIRQGRGYKEPMLVKKLMNSQSWTYGDINAANHMTVARFLAFAPVHEQDNVMGLVLRAELPVWYFRKILTSFQQINAHQRTLAKACPSNKVLVIAPGNVIFLSSD